MIEPSARQEEPPAAGDADGGGLTAWERISFSIVHTLLRGLIVIVSLPGLYYLGLFFGTLEWLVNHNRRRRFARAYRRISTAQPTASELRRATRAFFIQSRCDKLFYLIFDCLSRDKALSLFELGNAALIDNALARGKGVYLAMSHHGPHHVAGMLLALKGYKVAAVRDRQESGLRRFVQDRFDRLYPEFERMRVIYADAFPREIYRCFKAGYVLGSAMDVSRLRHSSQRVETVTMFGEERLVLTGPLRAAIRCRVPVIQAFIKPERGFRYRLDAVDLLIDPDHTADEDEAVKQAVERYAHNIERHLQATPSLISRV